MTQKEINCFGFDVLMNNRNWNLIEPYQFSKSGDDVYVRFDATTGDCSIIKINKNSNLYTQTWAYGNWDSRTSLDYKPINETRVITVDD